MLVPRTQYFNGWSSQKGVDRYLNKKENKL